MKTVPGRALLLVACMGIASCARKYPVSGTVIDAAERPVPGAFVIMKLTGGGKPDILARYTTIETDANGRFIINVPGEPTSVVVISKGYDPLETSSIDRNPVSSDYSLQYRLETGGMSPEMRAGYLNNYRSFLPPGALPALDGPKN